MGLNIFFNSSSEKYFFSSNSSSPKLLMIENGVLMISGMFFAETYSDALMVMMGLNCNPPLKPIMHKAMMAEFNTIHETICPKSLKGLLVFELCSLPSVVFRVGAFAFVLL